MYIKLLHHSFPLPPQMQLGKGSKKKNREYNEFGTKGGRGSDLNHYFKQL